jgi:hypothetical protein
MNQLTPPTYIISPLIVYLCTAEMRLPPSVVSLIESHLGLPPTLKQVAPKETSFKAFATNLQPLVPGRPSPTRTSTTSRNLPRAATSIRRQAPKRIISDKNVLSLEEALERYPTKPQIALGAAHRLLNEQQNAPSTSSRIDYIIQRQRICTNIIKAFSTHPESAKVTIASIYQRLVDEDIPPTNEILKIVLGTALRNGTPIMPILRGLIAREGLSEEVDNHLLLLVIKGMAREVNIDPKEELERVIDDCLSVQRGKGKGKERPIGFDEILVESYGRKGDLKAMIDLLSRHTKPSQGVSSLYLQALTQWIGNPTLRNKRRGSLFPRALAKDLITIYGGAEKLPLEWLNAWMNGERIANNLETALNVWTVIDSSRIIPDANTYSVYMRLIKLLSHDDGKYRLRQAVKDILDPASRIELNTEILEHALGAAFTHDDLPLVLLLARQLDYSTDQHLSKISPSARAIDILAAGFIRSQRSAQTTSKPGSNAIIPEEWERITRLINSESGFEVSLPLNTPLAGLVVGQEEDQYIGQFKPRSRTHVRASLVLPLIRILEKAVVQQLRGGGLRGGDEDILRAVMEDVNAEISP